MAGKPGILFIYTFYAELTAKGKKSTTILPWLCMFLDISHSKYLYVSKSCYINQIIFNLANLQPYKILELKFN